MKEISFNNINEFLIYKAISGSHSYGLNTKESDIDERGVYFLPNEYLYSLSYYKEQVESNKNDIIYYEFNRFVQLLVKQNPNILELLWTHDKFIKLENSRFLILKNNRKLFLSKLCKYTFGGYAISQIKKAVGLNKKIINPLKKEKKIPLDFCYVLERGVSTPVKKWFINNNKDISKVGLSSYNHAKDCYSMYLSDSIVFRGICFENSNDIHLSNIPKENVVYLGILFYNKDAYSKYCKEYKEYFEWEKMRNPVRYNINRSHGKNYDGKNLMHCFRLLDMGIEIAKKQEINLLRNDKDFLLKIKYGEFNYDELILLAEEKVEELNKEFEKSTLRDEIDIEFVNNLILDVRREY